jgi:hypothetical protein
VFVRFAEGKVYFNIHVFVLSHLVSPSVVCVLFVLPSLIMNMHFIPNSARGYRPERHGTGPPHCALFLVLESYSRIRGNDRSYRLGSLQASSCSLDVVQARCSIPQPATAAATLAISTPSRAIAPQAPSKSAVFTSGDSARLRVTAGKSSRVVLE